IDHHHPVCAELGRYAIFLLTAQPPLLGSGGESRSAATLGNIAGNASLRLRPEHGPDLRLSSTNNPVLASREWYRCSHPVPDTHESVRLRRAWYLRSSR